MEVKKIWFIFKANKLVMNATSSFLEETRRKSEWRKIVETPFWTESWFHAASSNKREPGAQQVHPSKVINFGRPSANFPRKILNKNKGSNRCHANYAKKIKRS